MQKTNNFETAMHMLPRREKNRLKEFCTDIKEKEALKLHIAHKDLLDKYQRLENEKRMLQSKNDADNSLVVQLQSKIDGIEDENSTLNEKYATIEAQYRNAHQDLVDMKFVLNDNKQVIDVLKLREADMKLHIEHVEADRNSLREQIKTVLEQNDDLKSLLKSLQDENCSLKNHHTKNSRDPNIRDSDLKLQNDNLRVQITNLKDRIEQLNAFLNEAEAEKEFYKSKVDRLYVQRDQWKRKSTDAISSPMIEERPAQRVRIKEDSPK